MAGAAARLLVPAADLFRLEGERYREVEAVPDLARLAETRERPRAPALEGNTAVGNNSNGGEVLRRLRTENLVAAFVTVQG